MYILIIYIFVYFVNIIDFIDLISCINMDKKQKNRVIWPIVQVYSIGEIYVFKYIN